MMIQAQKDLLELVRKVIAEHPVEYERARYEDDHGGITVAQWLLGKTMARIAVEEDNKHDQQ